MDKNICSIHAWMLPDMDLMEAGIALKCRCGADMATDMANVQFDDKGLVKVGTRPIRCPDCGAIYRYGERLRYHLTHARPVLRLNGRIFPPFRPVS